MTRKLNFYYLSIFILFTTQHNQAMKPADVEISINKANDKYNKGIKKITKEYDDLEEKSHHEYEAKHKNLVDIRDHTLNNNKPNNKERIEKRKSDREAIEKAKKQKINEVDEVYKQSSAEWINSGKNIFLTDINTREKTTTLHPHYPRAEKIKEIEGEFKKKYDELDKIYSEEATKEQEQFECSKKQAKLVFAAQHINIFTIYNNKDDEYQKTLIKKRKAAIKKHCKSIKKTGTDFFSAHPELRREFPLKSNKETKESVSPLTTITLLTKKAIKPIKSTKKPTLKRKKITEAIIDLNHKHTYDLRLPKKPRQR